MDPKIINQYQIALSDFPSSGLGYDQGPIPTPPRCTPSRLGGESGKNPSLPALNAEIDAVLKLTELLLVG